MSSLLQRRSFLVLAAITIFLVGAGAGFWRYHQTEATLRAALVIKASRCAVAFDPAELKRLSGSRDDLPTPLYAEVKSRLIRLRAVEPSVRSVSLLRYLPDEKQVILLADAEPPDSPDISRPGERDPAVPSPALQQVIASGTAMSEGPHTDQFGTWVSAFAPISSPEGGET